MLLTPLPEGAGSRENSGPTSELWTSHGLLFGIIQALRNPSSPLTMLLQNSTNLQVSTGNGASDGSRGSGTLALLSYMGFRQRVGI